MLYLKKLKDFNVTQHSDTENKNSLKLSKIRLTLLSAAAAFTIAACGGLTAGNSSNTASQSAKDGIVKAPQYSYPAGSLEAGFANPPQASKPRTWLHAMNSNMSKVGFTKDLEAMAEAGLGGLLLFTVSAYIPNGNVIFGTDEHYDSIKHAAAEAERLGLSFGMHNSDGWIASGGPWITPKDSMKMVTWSETISKGGKVKIRLPQPTARHGLYVDESVIAYPATKSEIYDSQLTPTITTSERQGDLSLLMDQRSDEPVYISGENKKAWMVLDYGKPVELNYLWMQVNAKLHLSRTYDLSISDDGKNYTQLAKDKKLTRVGKKEFAIEHPLEGVNTRYIKIEWTNEFEISEVSVTQSNRFDNFLARSNRTLIEDNRLKPLYDIKQHADFPIIDKSRLIDLTKNMNAKGELTTTLPKGTWNIMRFGYTTTGAMNGPASDAGRGLESDKMDKKAVKLHYDSYVGKVADQVRDIAPNALQYMEIDSFEVGSQNWTHDYLTKFEQHHGYSLLPFMPIFAGKIVESQSATDKVLWDLRLYNSQLITENYFGYFTELTHQDGLISYIEPYSFNAAYNELEAGGKTDIPMGEFWLRGYQEITIATSAAHIYGKPVVSTEAFTALPKWNWRTHPGVFKSIGDDAWTQGVNEYFFHRYAHQPNTHVEPGMTMAGWGSNIDRNQTWWRSGAANAWFEYIARGSFVLRQGYPVSDVLVFIGEGAPNSILERKDLNNMPLAINYDNVNDDVILNRLTVKNGRLTLPEGTNYKALVLKNHHKMTLPLLRKLSEFSKQGVQIVGDKPTTIANYISNKADLTEFNQLVKEIWSRDNTISIRGKVDWDKLYTKLGLVYDLEVTNVKDRNKGMSYTHRKIENKDVYFLANTEGEAKILDLKISKQDLKNISSIERWDAMTGEMKQIAQYTESDDFVEIPLFLKDDESAFIVIKQDEGKQPVVVTSIESAQANQSQKSKAQQPAVATRAISLAGKTQDAIALEVTENNQFNVTYSNGTSTKVNIDNLPGAYGVTSPWTVTFNRLPNLKPIVTETLFDWSEHENDDIKHYSGTAVYKTRFDLPAKFKAANINNYLDLGTVDITANITINGYRLPPLWASPFEVNVSDYLKAGTNTLEIEVTNQWTNRLIGDERYDRTDNYTTEGSNTKNAKIMPAWYMNNEPMPKGKRTTFSAFPFYKPGDKLEPAGLKGPVRIFATKMVMLKP
ncbi:MAG: glycosyl hydrolase [Thalassotalea sp.]